eukprot:snap_masked-scaffold_1-processed-gene-16.54-mRNA-1 protein AED:1.00 eAED:1.00 QI:0/0/0/0/1/1/2/0/86
MKPKYVGISFNKVNLNGFTEIMKFFYIQKLVIANNDFCFLTMNCQKIFCFDFNFTGYRWRSIPNRVIHIYSAVGTLLLEYCKIIKF